MIDITRKTTGYLIGELVTHTIKSKYARTEEQRSNAQLRIALLNEAINARMASQGITRDNSAYMQLFSSLMRACKECWDAQEIVMTSEDPREVFHAAKTTLIANRERNVQMRALDDLFGEKFFAVLEKVYVLE